ncbi:MAG: hypothetical protein EZS28_020355 [Streblomastix strix]|uniref:Uncharacterized protein n=1 Tax=Streblomastix strix TaxID=222440 RepID=A0A5J4VNL7_9EUKA|nr:MAG: hypothetical protein EZS28_020355 [Streblomastix strix]
METIIETNNEVQSEQVDTFAGQKRSFGRPKKYFNDDDRKEAIRKQQLAIKRIYAQKKAQIYKDDMGFLLEYLQTDIEQKIMPKDN